MRRNAQRQVTHGDDEIALECIEFISGERERAEKAANNSNLRESNAFHHL